MGNFSVNHYSRLSVGAEQLDIVYALDLAEIPTFELLQAWNLTATSPRKSMEQKAAQLIDAANHNGGRDNISVLMVEVSDEPEKRGLIARLLGK